MSLISRLLNLKTLILDIIKPVCDKAKSKRNYYLAVNMLNSLLLISWWPCWRPSKWSLERPRLEVKRKSITSLLGVGRRYRHDYWETIPTLVLWLKMRLWPATVAYLEYRYLAEILTRFIQPHCLILQTREKPGWSEMGGLVAWWAYFESPGKSD